VAARRDQRGVVFPSPVVILSVIAVAMAGVAFLFTRDSGPAEKEITTTSQQQTPSPSPSSTTPGQGATGQGKPDKPKHDKPQIDRSRIYVVVFNNSPVSGLAAKVAAKASQIGWQVVGADNWYGTIPSSTVYYPPAMEKAGKLLALDLGITRTAPAVDPMRTDRLTVILTGPLSG
jgi:hypothetical protein